MMVKVLLMKLKMMTLGRRWSDGGDGVCLGVRSWRWLSPPPGVVVGHQRSLIEAASAAWLLEETREIE